MRIKKSIECWIYNYQTNKFLLLHCPETLKHRPYWQPVAGGIESGETPAESCLREIREETGLVFEEKDIIRVINNFSVSVPQNNMDLSKNVFVVKTDNSAVTISNEHDDFKWTPPENVESLLLWDSNKSTFQEVSKFLSISFKKESQSEV